MKLDNIAFYNYRCFADFKIEFAPEVNVLIGKNGAGKTSAVKGIVKALSFMFSNDRSLGNDFLSAGLNTLNVRTIGEGDFLYERMSRKVASDAEIVANAFFDGDRLPEWRLYKRSTSGAALYPSRYKMAFQDLMRRVEAGAELPLLATFSDSFPHHNTKLTAHARNIALTDDVQRNFGYYQWDDENACMGIWETRLCTVLNRTIQLRALMEQGDENEKARIESENRIVFEEEREILSALKRFSQSLPEDDFAIQFVTPGVTGNNEWELILVLANGAMRSLEELPAGYRRVFSIALDIIYRSWILNRNVNPRGIVVIDEVDLHLHPELEQAIVKALRDCFPRLQFIMTTHSPLVVSNLPTQSGANRLISMPTNHSEPTYLKSAFGLDYDSSVESIMGVRLRTGELNALIESYCMLKDEGLDEKAGKFKDVIMEFVGSEEQFDERVRSYRERQV
ncbi:MAG: AAA family ATPase [Muribaculaceae bacterium]|nr:AAA family ATPase [Muribaculaceae bacterium]